MTNTTVPTNEEIDRLLAMHWPAVFAVTEPVIQCMLRQAVREAVAKWGAPAPASGQPVAIYRGRCVIDCGEHGHHDIELLKMIPAGSNLYAAPPAPEVRAPLSDKQVDELASPYLLRMFGTGKIFPEVMRGFARAIERAHGITTKESTP